MSSTVLTPQVPPLWRLKTVGTAMLLICLALWLSVSVLGLWAGPTVESSADQAAHGGSGLLHTLHAGTGLPKPVAVLITAALTLCGVSLLLALAQRSTTDLVLAGATWLWAVYVGLGARWLASPESSLDVTTTVALQAILLGAVALSLWYGLHLLKRTGLTPHPVSMIKVMAWAGSLALLLSAAGTVDRPIFWILPIACLLACASALVRMVDMARRPGSLLRPSVTAWLLAVSVAVAVAAGTHELWLRMVDSGLSDARVLAWFTTRWAILLVMACALGLRLDHLARMLRQLGSSHSAWRKRVRDVQRALQQTNERLILRDRSEAQRQQRDRILRELHDELGHRLLAAMALAQSGQPRPLGERDPMPQLQRLIDSSLIELRLAYDALELVPRPLAEAMQELKLQLEPMFDDARVGLRWVVDTRAAMLVLPTADTLQVLRIVREALAPMLERTPDQPGSAPLTLCKVMLDVPDGETGRHLRLRISDEPLADDGSVAEPLARLGSGWIKLQRQATSLGAQLALDPQAGPHRNGWSLELVMPLAGR